MSVTFLTNEDETRIQKQISELSEQIANIGGLVEPNEDDIPKVFIDGVIPTTKDDVLAEMTYVSNTDKFHSYLKIKCQGNSSMAYSKKNFTIKMYSDEARETKLKKAFKDWKFEQNKYVLKANFIDHSHARNIVSARLWSEVVASRSDYDLLPTEFKTSPKNGAIDGFPIKLYTNGTYQGIYTWNIGKDDWLWNMDEDNPNHILMCGETNTDGIYRETPCNFRALWSGINEQNWSVEVGTNSDSVKISLNDLISCVKDTDDETFKATIDNHLDVQSAIDYWIHQYIICGIDGLAKNMLLGTYDLQKWCMGAYDMDSTFGLWWDGNRFVSSEFRCPEDYQEKYNLLFERITELYSDRVKERYAELRKTVYSTNNMFTHFERFMDVIGKDLYAGDLDVYTGIPSGSTNNIKQIRDYIRDRLYYCDLQFGMIEESDIIYQLAEPMVFDGTSTYLDTGVQLFNEPKDSTVFIDFESGEQSETKEAILMISCSVESTNKADFSIKKVVGNNYVVFRTSGVEPVIEDVVNGNWGHSLARTRKIALVFKNGLFEYGKYYLTTESQPRYLEKKDGATFTENNATLIIGARENFWTPDSYLDFWKGTVNDFRVYNRALSEEEVNALILSY